MKFVISISTLLLALYLPLAKAFELSAEPGMANMLNANEDTLIGQRSVSMALTKTAPDSKWAASATCGLLDPNNEQNAVLLRIVQNFPSDEKLFFVFSHFEKAKLKDQKILASGVKMNEPQSFEIRWNNGEVKINLGESLVVETPISFALARFYCGISSGTASFDIET